MRKINSKLALGLAFTITTVVIVLLLIANIVVTITDSGEKGPIILLLSIFIIISLFVYGLVIIQIYKTRLHTTNSLLSSVNSIESSQEEIFEIGLIIFNDEQLVSYISPWMLDEGFDKFLGKKIDTFKLDVETPKKQIFEYASRKWEVVVSRKNKTFLFKDITEQEVLKQFILEQYNAVLSIHTTFSKKANFNEAMKSQVSIAIIQSLQEWTNKVRGSYTVNTSSENTSMIIFRWALGEKDITSEAILNKIKTDLGKLAKEATISMGATYGRNEISELQEKSLKVLALSKSRGGDQIVMEEPNGQTKYIGASSAQTSSNSALNVKKFYTQFIIDIENAREVFITSHKFADLDALGSVMGTYDIAKQHNKETWMVLEKYDSTTQRMISTLPKAYKDRIITQTEALKLKTNRSHIVLTDISRPEGSQASKLFENISPEKISIIDHHRASEEIVKFDQEKVLVETSVSSASELVVEMLKLTYNQDAQSLVDTNVSTALLAGIQLDSKQLTKNVTNATFDAVSFLINNEASTAETQGLFKPSQDLLKVEADALKNITKPSKDVIFTFIDEKIITKEEDTSIIADRLLEYEDVTASFVLAKVEGDKFKLSARSNDKINVQLICESLGGGGHFNVAAASWKSNIQYNTVKKRVLNSINKGI